MTNRPQDDMPDVIYVTDDLAWTGDNCPDTEQYTRTARLIEMLEGMKRGQSKCKCGDAKCIAETCAYDTGHDHAIDAAIKAIKEIR